MVFYNDIEFYPIKNFKGYFISKCGKVLSTRPKNGRGECDMKHLREINPCINNHGYKTIHLFNGKKMVKSIHTILGDTFLKDSKNENVEIDHIDRNRLNNNLNNLRFVSKSDNQRNKNGTGVFKRLDNRWNHEFYVATWFDEKGKNKQKSFSINKYGEDEAFKLATELRQEMVEKYYNRP